MVRSSRGWLLTLVLLLGASAAPRDVAAQHAAGQKYLGGHIGVSGVGTAAAIGVNGEISYNENVTIGAWADTWGYGEDYATGAGVASWDVRYVALAGTGAYHFSIEERPKLDPFVGAAVGYYVVSTSSSVGGITYGGDASRLFVGGYGGLRYFFKPAMAGVARVGFGSAYLTLGLDFKL
jgi:hypothetical protein